jgi:hypothetical protein
MEKEVNVRTYTYAQLDCKYDALCLKIKYTVRGALEYMQQYSRTIKHAFSWLWAMRLRGEGELYKVIDHG